MTITHHAAQRIGYSCILTMLVTIIPSATATESSVLRPRTITGGSHSPAASRGYTLLAGEDADLVARRFGISVEALRKLNQFRTFARGFDHIRPGDEVDVPLVTRGEQARTAPQPDDDATAKAAGVASQAGTFLSASPNGAAAASLARGMAMGEATRTVQGWMSQFGTARVQLDADPHFSLKNSSFDLLMPLYEQQHALLFTQGSVHRTDDRTQTNLGGGVRWFGEAWMLGGNTFLDHDLSRDHTRMGMGMEYWRDYLKLGANGYLRVSQWKDSLDVGKRPV